MDDFGTGYSSLSYLRSFPFDRLKIDRSFIRDLSRGRDGVAIVSAIINLARGLDVGVVAEGVETIEQLRCLVAEGCDEIQGFFFSPPRPASAIPEVFAHCNERIKLAA
jgi:EAL domain-containing protein (putative c-di-GMP-specific phosphodiesterase class I)